MSGHMKYKETLEMRKCFSEPGKAGSSSHDEADQVHTSVGRKNGNHRFKEFYLFQNAFFLKDSHLTPTSIPCRAYNIIGFEPLHILHRGISIVA